MPYLLHLYSSIHDDYRCSYHVNKLQIEQVNENQYVISGPGYFQSVTSVKKPFIESTSLTFAEFSKDFANKLAKQIPKTRKDVLNYKNLSHAQDGSDSVLAPKGPNRFIKMFKVLQGKL